MKAAPALELRFPPLSGSSDLADRLLALVDDLQPVAIDEGACAPDTEDAPPQSWRVYFASPEARDHAATVLAGAFGAAGLCFRAIDVDDAGWVERSQAMLAAIRVDGVVVAPPWDVLSNSDALIVVIRPSMGFGTGHHASTRLCLRALQQVDVSGRTVLDVGTGSGVLAIAAVKLGAARVVAVDRDVDALASARDNIALNGVTDRVALHLADLGATDGLGLAPSDVVLANLTASVLVRDADSLRRHIAPGGVLIAGGITRDQVAGVLAAFGTRTQMKLAQRHEEDEWVTLMLCAER